MSATFPAAIKQFVAHKNNIEDIDASHVNSLQDEVAAVQTSIGTYPNIDPTLNNQFNDYGSVRGRMEQTQRGSHIPVVSVSRNISRQSVANNVPTNIVWDNNTQIDPFNMFSSGTDIVLSKTGWWIINGGAAFNNNNDTNLRSVVLNWANMRGSNLNATSSWGFLTGTNTNWDQTSMSNLGIPPAYTVTWTGKLPAGAVLRILLQQQSGITLSVIGNLTATCIREI